MLNDLEVVCVGEMGTTLYRMSFPALTHIIWGRGEGGGSTYQARKHCTAGAYLSGATYKGDPVVCKVATGALAMRNQLIELAVVS